MKKNHEERLAEIRAKLYEVNEELNQVVEASWRSLAADYAVCKADLAHAAEEVCVTFGLMTEAKRTLATAREDAKFHLSMAILGALGTDKLNGKNAEIRKLKQDVFIGQLPAEDAQYKQLSDAVTAGELVVDQATIDYETARVRMSAIRNQARMLAGLGHAIGG